jgi:hypothetical protein
LGSRLVYFFEMICQATAFGPEFIRRIPRWPRTLMARNESPPNFS